MRKSLIIIFLVVILLITGCTSVGKALDDKAEIVLPFDRYSDVNFIGDYYAVMEKGTEMYQIIDKDGKVIVKPKHQSISEITVDNKVLYIVESKDDSGEVNVYGVLDDQLNEVVIFREKMSRQEILNYLTLKSNLIPTRGESDEYGYKNIQTGEWVIRPQYKVAHPFNDGIAVVGVSKKAHIGGEFGVTMESIEYGYINEKGEYLLPPKPQHNNLYDFSSGIGVLPIISHKEVSVRLDLPLAQWLLGIDDEVTTTKTEITYMFIDNEGYISDERAWEDTKGYNYGYAYVYNNKKWSVIDKDGNMIKRDMYDNVIGPGNGYYAVEVFGKRGIADYSGEIIIPPNRIFAEEMFGNLRTLLIYLEPIGESMYIVGDDQHNRYLIDAKTIDLKNSIDELKLIPRDESILVYSDGIIISRIGNVLEFTNSSTKEVTTIKCEDIIAYNRKSGEVIIKLKNKLGVIKPLMLAQNKDQSNITGFEDTKKEDVVRNVDSEHVDAMKDNVDVIEPVESVNDIVQESISKYEEIEVNIINNEYILPSSNIAYVDKKELIEFTPKELTLARNEIYARHGRPFLREDIRNYFLGKSWYNPVNSFDDSYYWNHLFNEYEKYNIELILSFEKE